MDEINHKTEREMPHFICDAMLGGLARWLRAAGYAAEFDVHARDGALVRRSYKEGKTLLSSDSGIFDRYAIREGLAPALFIPQDLSIIEQLGFVLGKLDLELRPALCMECGGELDRVPLDDVDSEVPEKVQKRCEL